MKDDENPERMWSVYASEQYETLLALYIVQDTSRVGCVIPAVNVLLIFYSEKLVVDH
jgi:hypothetical protein